MKKSRKIVKKLLTKLVLCVVLLLVFSTLCQAKGSTNYELIVKKRAAKIGLDIVHQIENYFKWTDDLKKYQGSIYEAPNPDPLVRRSEYIQDMRDKRKVFKIFFVYYF